VTTKDVFDALQSGGLLAGLLLAIITGSRGQWMFRSAHLAIVAVMDRELAQVRAELAKAEKRGDEWREIALRGLNVSEEVVKGRGTP
jgi:hypothetical protein